MSTPRWIEGHYETDDEVEVAALRAQVEELTRERAFNADNWQRAGSRAEQAEAKLAKVVEALEIARALMSDYAPRMWSEHIADIDVALAAAKGTE